MNEIEWKRAGYETWEDAFNALSPSIRQQSVRVASYTQAIFIAACATSYSKTNAEFKIRMKGTYADLVYKCGLYHQLGKALVPHHYQTFQRDFTQEEIAVYRKYTTDGKELVAKLQENTLDEKEKSKGASSRAVTKNIPWSMMREACEQHMETFDGTGYPEGKQGNEISCIAQIIGIAKELDRLSTETKSENPFDYAYETIVSKSGKSYSAELVEILKSIRPKCRVIYNKYVYYTKVLPKTIPLVEKQKSRPMGLEYRPLVAQIDGNAVAYEAQPWFTKNLGEYEDKDTIEELEPMLKRTNLVADLSMYFLYEACDAIYRIENCKIDIRAVLIRLPQSFFTGGSQLARLTQLFEDQPIKRETLKLLVDQELIENGTKSVMEVLERYVRNGISLVIDGYNPEQVSPEVLQTLGIDQVRLSPDLYMRQESCKWMKRLKTHNIRVIAGEVNTHEVQAWLAANGVEYMGGTITGMTRSENELIRDALARELES